MLALKAFMRDNGIADVRMRMLKELELKRIQGFPDDYVLHGPQNEKKKFKKHNCSIRNWKPKEQGKSYC